jgi:energy-coupling factor transporter ATP-binding protein EcfA2
VGGCAAEGGGRRRAAAGGSLSGQSVKAQPGYSGSPVWEHDGDQAIGLLQVAPFADEPGRDAYLLPPMAIGQAWDEPFDYLLVPDNPYRGPEPFTPGQAGMFFGRDADIAALAKRVHAQPAVVVVGPSGAGKSSLVQAGLVRALQEEQQWSVALVRPGADPWPQLAAAMLGARRGQQPQLTLEETRREVDRLRKEGLGQAARFLRSQDRPLLVVVDQFEELLARGEPDRDLLDLLLAAPEAADDAVRLVLTPRSDFLPALQSIPGFHTRLNERLYLLGVHHDDAVEGTAPQEADLRRLPRDGRRARRAGASRRGKRRPALP